MKENNKGKREINYNREDMIYSLKLKILNGNFLFLDSIIDLVERNKMLLSDNYGEVNKFEQESIDYLIPFMHLLYRGSKHSVGNLCESGFTRVVVYKGKNMRFTYYSAHETFVKVEFIDDITGIKPIVTMELLQERLSEAEDVKRELTPIIEKYLTQGLTFEEITRMFVEIMRENRIKI